MRHIYNFKNFSINENNLLLESLVNPIKLTPEEHKTMGRFINNWLTQNFKLPNVLNSLMQWISRDRKIEGVMFPKDLNKWPNQFGKESMMWDAVKMGFIEERFQLAVEFRNWVYFIGCTLTKDNPMYDALRNSMGTPSGQFQSEKIPLLRSSDTEEFQKGLNPNNPAHQVVKGVVNLRNKYTDWTDKRKADQGTGKMIESELLDDEGFKNLIKVCQQIVAKSGIEKQVNVEQNTKLQSQEGGTSDEKPVGAQEKPSGIPPRNLAQSEPNKPLPKLTRKSGK